MATSSLEPNELLPVVESAAKIEFKSKESFLVLSQLSGLFDFNEAFLIALVRVLAILAFIYWEGKQNSEGNCFLYARVL